MKLNLATKRANPLLIANPDFNYRAQVITETRWKPIKVMEKLRSYTTAVKSKWLHLRHLIFWRVLIKGKTWRDPPQLLRTVKYAFYCSGHNGGRLAREQYGRPIIWTKENKVFSLMKLKFNCVLQNDLFRADVGPRSLLRSPLSFWTVRKKVYVPYIIMNNTKIMALKWYILF